MSIMQSLEDQILSLKSRNFEKVSFIPGEDLDNLVTKDLVREAVIHSGIEPTRREETVLAVLSGARKIFSILVLLRKSQSIRKFIEHDQFQVVNLDAKLPFPELWLQEILGKAAGSDFWDKQWMFVAPFFRYDLSHRVLEDAAVLPFKESSFIGEGAFGTVFRVLLHAGHQGIKAVRDKQSVVELVRKRVEIKPQSAESPEHEGNILSVLRLVQHPNIVRLVTTFEYRGTYNLLFEPADMNLAQLLQLEAEFLPPGLETEVQFLIALQGLSSAIATLHEFYSPEFDVQHIGCHHDLKPDNVLVKGGALLLADFGLSRLKTPGKDSKTSFRGVNNHNAPECLFADEGLISSKTGRKSDIWAFGCIILDIVTYLRRGAQGVTQFEKGRKWRADAFTFYQFHCGGKEHPFVQLWIQEMEKVAPTGYGSVFALVRRMITIHPDDRPSALSVLKSLSFAALRFNVISIKPDFERLPVADSYILSVERKRVELWTDVLGLSQDSQSWDAIEEVVELGVDFGNLSGRVSRIKGILSVLEGQPSPKTSPAMRQLQGHVDGMINLLKPVQRSKLENLLELQLLHESCPEYILDSSSTPRDPCMANLRLLAIAKIMSDKGNLSSLTLHAPDEADAGRIKIQEAFGSQSSLATLEEEDRAIPILIEWMVYNRNWHGEVGIELYDRVKTLATVLHVGQKPLGFSNLDCIGYYHAIQRHSFGLLFALPDAAAQPKTLAQLFVDIPARALDRRPPLGDVFAVARNITNSVLQFHKANWLHKNISSRNICFLSDQDKPSKLLLSRPYLIGFSHSRQDDPDAFTHGPDPDPYLRDYSHPEYLRNESRFSLHYDYYSLGLVLLELGLWKPLASMSVMMQNEIDQSPEALRTFLLRKYVPRLGSTMGLKYRSAVEECLTFSVSSESYEGDRPRGTSTLLAFEEKIVVALGTCNL